ncbi:MAG: YicC/YloC family endoribonuclease [Bacillota bacterium]|nr:YicC family protein [Bacillota bacterium]MDD3297588.1 YicC family protein [Bacillota bacterium]MDD3850972.1 YicC family protein [Bacillota bacterium]MDD4707293.1 YicC family protein [Bacillota bacterium]
MVNSMTGFGRSEYSTGNTAISVEVRSVNHRYNDISIRTPKSLSFLEDRIRRYVQSRVSRGRVDIYVSYDSWELKEQDVKVNSQMAHKYYNALKELREELGHKGDIPFSIIATFPDVIMVRQGELDEDELWNQFSSTLEQAVDVLIEMRSKEGENLKKDILSKLETIDKEVSEIEKRAAFIVEEYRDRLEKRLECLADGMELDSDRVYQEVLIFADRSNIDEELVRLGSHTSQMRDILGDGGTIGRKLDFLVQEMHREINTIGSKANDLHISKAVIEVKSQLEKVREQIQNIE